MHKKMESKTFLALALPLMVQSITTTIVSATDALMLGSLGQESLAAVTLAGQYIQIFNFFLIALSVGSTALLAQYYGNQDQESVRKILNITLQISLSVGLMVSLSILLIPGLIMSVFTNDSELIVIGSSYLRISFLAPFFMSLSLMYTNFMKNTGSAKQSSIYGILTVSINVFLNWILIYGMFGAPAMGASGAGLATLIARGVEFFLLVSVAKRNQYAPLHFKDLFRSYKAMMRKYLRYTLPSIIQTVSWVTASSLTIAIIGHQNSDLIAASAVAMIIYNIATGASNGYASAAGILTGQMMGRGEMEEARHTGDKLMRWSVIVSLAAAIIVIVLCPFICSRYDHMSPQAQYYLKLMIWFVAFRCVGKYINNTLSTGLFTAGGDIKYLMKVDIINMWGVVLPIGLLAAYAFHLPPMIVYIVLNLDEYYKIYFMIAHYRKYYWVRNLTKKEWAPISRYEDLIRRRIFKDMPMGILMIGSSGLISLTNEACARILGMTQEELEGSNFSTLFLSDCRNEAFADAVIDAVQDKENPHEYLVDYFVGNKTEKLNIRSIFIEDEDCKMGVCLMINPIGN